ncbi:methane/ammonia monooxygenase subunit C [Nitrosomonas sp. Nm34]|nr:methane/ammonia monooxygenase subunit C [Nitrosomonas sp. Nm34]
MVFYGSFPMYIVCGVATYLYAMTRLPLYSRGISFPLVMAIAGPLMILPNVGLNEWGHAFWFMEELFSAPLHWGFVVLGLVGPIYRRHRGTDRHPILQPDRSHLEWAEQSYPQ